MVATSEPGCNQADSFSIVWVAEVSVRDGNKGGLHLALSWHSNY